jgi:hypothetical protein
MILKIELDLKRIFKLGREYPWPRPEACRCGNNRLWGHGFVQMLFDGFARPLIMRRYRCPDCGCIIRLRPKGYFIRHQCQAAVIRRTLVQRIDTGRWPAGTCGSRARHWLSALKRNALAYFGMPGLCALMACFDTLIVAGRVPVCRTV